MTLKPYGAAANHSFVLICGRCGEAFCSPGDSSTENPSVVMRRWLEDRLLQAGTPYQVRVTTTGCLDVCPDSAITLRIVNTQNPDESVLTYTFEPSTDREAILTEIQKHLRKKPKQN